MAAVRIHDILPSRVLVTRSSARELEAALREAVGAGREALELDFSDVDGITPSFLDEVITILEQVLAEADDGSPRVIVVNPPTRLSAKFAAVGRSHHLEIREIGPGKWELVQAA